MTRDRSVIRGPGPFTEVPLSRAIRDGNSVFISGIVPMQDDASVTGSIEEQTTNVLSRISALMAEAGGSLDDIVSVRVYLSRPADYAAMNAVYAATFKPPYPARSCVVVTMVNPACFVVMEAVAQLQGPGES